MSRWPSIDEVVKEVKSGKVTAAQQVHKALETIEAKSEFDAVIAATTERAKLRAQEIDDGVKDGRDMGRLAGVPFIAKDNILAFGAETTAASNILKGFDTPYQATVIKQLEAEGAICVAKANLDAFAHGASTENSDFMITKNPHDKTRVAGGSSGGPAAAVILELAPFAIGTDTGGSIRQPASFTGAVGYKPTYGLVSRNGVIAMASSTDVIGPLTKTVEETALILDVISGRDQFDSTTIERDPKSYITFEKPKKTVKIGLIKEYLEGGIAPDVKSKIEDAAKQLKADGYDVKEVSLPSLPLALACYYIICPAEVSSNLSRYDGQRYGYSNRSANSLDDSYNWSRSEGFGKEAKRRIMIGTYVLSSGYYDAYYKQAMKLRTKLIKEFDKAFESFDYLIGPTAPSVAFKIGEKANDPLQMYLSDIMTVAANLVGVPSISIPVNSAGGLPIGLQIMSPQRSDRELLGMAKAAEELVG